MVPRLDEGSWPRITIALADSTEVENTLADIHYDPIQYDDSISTVIIGPLSPKNYEPITGVFTFKDEDVDQPVFPGMVVVDFDGVSHEILETFDGSFKIAENTVANFKNSTFKAASPTTAIHAESAIFKETYRIGVHVGGEPVYLTWLHSVIVFCLLRYREAYLEARGFERSAIGSSEFARNDMFEAENVFSRNITLTGYVHQYWPKFVGGVITGTVGRIRVMDSETLPTDIDPNTQLWIGEDDVLDE
jgi:hypothetical protein